MKALTTKQIIDKAGQLLIWSIGIATLLLILITTIFGIVKAATDTSLCIFGVIQ